MRQSLSVKIDPSIHHALKLYALDNNITIQQIMENLVVQFAEDNNLLKGRNSKKKVPKK